MSSSLQPHGLQQGRLPSLTNSWSLPTLKCTELVMSPNRLIPHCPLLFYLQSFPALRYFPMSWLFISGGQSLAASASAYNPILCLLFYCSKCSSFYHSGSQSVQSLSHVPLFVTPWIAEHQASLSITNSRSLPKLMSIKLVMSSSHLILCRPLLLLPPIPPNIRVFSNESTLHMRWPKYWSFSFNISPSNEQPGLISFRMTGWISV